jgi:hypothetical protein
VVGENGVIGESSNTRMLDRSVRKLVRLGLPLNGGGAAAAAAVAATLVCSGLGVGFRPGLSRVLRIRVSAGLSRRSNGRSGFAG